jgi:multiple sugar transport system permease protein
MTDGTLMGTPEMVSRPWLAWLRRDDDLFIGYLFLSPSLVLFVVFIAVPILGTVVLSFLDWSLMGAPTPVGLANYAALLGDHEFLIVLRNTLLYSFGTTAAHLVFGLALAIGVLRVRSKVIQYFVITAVVLPFLVCSGAVALIARYVMSDSFGPLNYYLRLLSFNPPDWLSSELWAMPALIAVDLWHTIGFTFLIFMVGLQGIPSDYYEAARLDGAGPIAQFRHVTLPLLSPTTFFVSVVSLIGAFQVFTWPYVITNGGPGISTETLAFYVYKLAFENFRFGYAATVSMCIVALLIVFTWLQFQVSKRWVHYDRL